MFYAICWLVAGFLLLVMGAEYTVKGSVAIANKLKIPMIIVGLTVVALGTSLPEFVVSVKAALKGVAGISIGNIVGSNIANILLILGGAALFYPVKCRRRIFLKSYKFLFLVIKSYCDIFLYLRKFSLILSYVTTVSFTE